MAIGFIVPTEFVELQPKLVETYLKRILKLASRNSQKWKKKKKEVLI